MEADDETTSVTMIDDEIYSNGGVGDGEEKRKGYLSSGLLDVEVYASLYSGRTKVTRLIFIADRCNNQAMKLEALRMAYEEIRKGENTNLFKEVVEKIDGKLGSEYCLDQSWVDNVNRQADLRMEKLLNELYVRKEKLGNELNAYRTDLIKESIRMGYNDFGDFHYSHGQLGDAFKNYARSLDCCTTSKHILQMCLNAILVSIEMGQFSHVATYVGKAEVTPDALDPVAVAKLRCAAGLSHLESKKYKLAARKFLETGPELGSNYTEVIAPQDVATYGGLCALASFDRSEFKGKVIDNVNFRKFLELVPEVREIINDFYSSRYASCLEYLESLKANLLLDIHLHDHVETLYSQIRHKAFIQYTHPFVFVDLCVMADDFKTDASVLEQELAALVTDSHYQELELRAAEVSHQLKRCRSKVLELEQALVAVPYVEQAQQLERKKKEVQTEIANANSYLRDKKSMSVKERRGWELRKKDFTTSMSRLTYEESQLKKHTRHGIEGMGSKQIEDVLQKAQLVYSKMMLEFAEIRNEVAGMEKLRRLFSLH